MKLLSICLLWLFASSGPAWQGDIQAAKKEAQQENKLILISFSGSDWCGPCIMLKKEVFSSDKFNDYAKDHLVLVRADFPRSKKNQLPEEQAKRNNALASQYNPEGNFPFTVLTDAQGKVIKSWVGYEPGHSDEYLAALEDAAAH